VHAYVCTHRYHDEIFSHVWKEQSTKINVHLFDNANDNMIQTRAYARGEYWG